ncbi:hypothetical protein DY000_02020168 [Brassica cretica]|uniref:Protein WAVE n=1 Tax=Brassica cretica TaxID=69181 RepID=A0ABQ7E2V2_BRACR|nr:hypothetical protein DY000_02020168 [Brassica cretica]
MENTKHDQPSIDGDTFPSSDVESEESTDTELPTSIDTTQPEAGKFSLTQPANEKVVQTELNGQTSNEASQTEQGTEIPVKENSALIKGEDIKLSIQDYLDPGKTYSNRSAIKIPGDDTKKSKLNADYYRMTQRMENTKHDQPSIDGDTFPSSDVESEESTDMELPTSIDTTQPEAGKFSLTQPANEKVVQTELNRQTSNEASQTEQGTEIPVKENSTLIKGEDIKLSIQDYLDPGATTVGLRRLENKLNPFAKLARRTIDRQRDQPSIDGGTFPSSNVESEESTDTELPTSIDTAQPEACKFSLTKPANEKVVQTELNGQTSNEASQTEQGTEIPVKENSTLTKGEDIKLSIQDYLDPGKTYSNRSAIKIPGDDTKKSKFNADYYRMTGKSNSHPILLNDLDPNPSQENRKTTAEKAKEKAIDLELEEDTEIEDEIDQQHKEWRTQSMTNHRSTETRFHRATLSKKNRPIRIGQHRSIPPSQKQGTEIPVKENSTLIKGEDIKLSIQDYLDPEIKNSLKSLHSFLQNKHRSDIARIDDDALSDTDDYLDEGTNCSDSYSVLHVDSFTQAYDTAVK